MHLLSPTLLLQHESKDYATTPPPQQQHGSPILDPCHICHRKPVVKSDLDSYADCEECGERTCYICIRECLGREDEEMEEALQMSFTEDACEGAGRAFFPRNGDGDGDEDGSERRKLRHRTMVCSRCCVERGTEGEVVCLGCLRREGGG